VVEHILLRPIPEDAGQMSAEGEPEVPMLRGVVGPDPWSLQVTVVLRGGGAQDDPYVRFVQQTIFAEAPAHLDVRILWLDDDGEADWTSFTGAWTEFVSLYSQHRRSKLAVVGPPLNAFFAVDSEPAVPSHLLVRAARDRLIDMLGIGRSARAEDGASLSYGTFPIRDLPVPQRIVVTPGADAKIRIGFTQRDVDYVLCDAIRFGEDDAGVQIEIDGVPVRVEGTGGPVEIPTPPIVDDITYRILAVKRQGADRQSTRRQAWLRTEVRLEESVDSSLIASIDLPLLDGRIDRPPAPTDARIGDYGVQAEIEVFASQEGVLYELVEHKEPMGEFPTHRVVSEQAVLGTSGTIRLRTIPIREDIDLRVRGSKSVGDPPQTRRGVLDLVLPLRARANPGFSITSSASIVSHGEAASVRIPDTQRSVQYQVWSAPVRDRDFAFDGDPPAVTIDVAAGPNVARVLRPPGPGPWEQLARFSPWGPAVAGNGGELVFDTGALDADSVLVVKASKQHATGPLSAPGELLPSAIQLDRALALLVRPDHLRRLQLTATIRGGMTTGPVLFQNGQPGVFYEMSVGGGAPVPAKAYFHQRNDLDAALNKGIGERPRTVDRGSLRITKDFVITDTHPPGDPARIAPSPPRVDTPPLATGSVLRIRARKAMNGLEAELVGSVVIEPFPPLGAIPPTVTAGASSKIVIDPSRAGERYWLVSPNGQASEVVDGTGGRVELSTGPLQRSSTIVVAALASSPAASSTLERRIEVTIEVVPP